MCVYYEDKCSPVCFDIKEVTVFPHCALNILHCRIIKLWGKLLVNNVITVSINPSANTW